MAELTVTKKLTKTSLLHGKRNGVSRIYDAEQKGFFARFNTDGTATLNYRYRSKLDPSKRPVIKLGIWPTLDVEEARVIAKNYAADIAKNIEPQIELMREREEKAEAKRLKAKAKASILGNFIDAHYDAHMKRNKRGHQDVARLKRRFGHWLALDMNLLTKSHVYETQQEAEKVVSFQTLKRDYAVLQGALNYAVEVGVIERNPIKGVSLKRPKSDALDLTADTPSLGERRVLTASEREGLFKGLEEYTRQMKDMRRRSRLKKSNRHLPDWDQVTYVDHVVPVVLVMYYTGFRNGDVLGLRWEHFLDDFKVIGKVIEKIAHHGKGKMYFPVTDPCQRVIKTWWEQEGRPETGWVFYSPRHREERRRLSESAMRKPWEKIKKWGELDASLDLYTLRHNFASLYIMAKADLLTVRNLMGHSDIKTTTDHYTHLDREHLAKMVKSVEGKF
ncbi:tyrosine-type recombinase/integrase [Halomonas sp. SIMBA_159]